MLIDTNVLRVVDGFAGQADPTCVAACADAIDAARRGIVHLDRGGLILAEYRNETTPRPYLPGTLFLHHLLRNQGNVQRCSVHEISADPTRGFVEFPDDDRLDYFDQSDRKFVAVAIVAPDDPPIVNATDSDWAPVTEALGDHGIEIVQLCPHLHEEA